MLQNEVRLGLCALAIMTKAPRAGAVKTRLQPPLSAEEAAALNVCFLRDTAEAISHAGKLSQGVGVYTPIGSESLYEGILPQDFSLLPQRGETFGERLAHAVHDLLKAGFESCCLINSDSPTATADVFRQAAEHLRTGKGRVVVGPSDDGGYYLIGMKQLHLRLFQDIDWSTGKVLSQTMDRAREIGLEVHTLETFYDIDDRAALFRLCDELFDQERNCARATKRFLAETIAREGRDRIWPRQ